MFANENATKKILVELSLSDGKTLTGHIVLAVAADLMRTMNGDTKFLEFVELGQPTRYIAKAGILQMLPR
jgi:hypothetical protein